MADYLRLAHALRSAGIGVEVFPEPKKLGQQLKYADSRGHTLAIIAGDNEFASGVVQLKNLRSTESHSVPMEGDLAGLVAAVRQALA